MNEMSRTDQPTPHERLTAALLRWAPWILFFLIALPAPLYFLMRYLTATEDIAVYMLLALTSLAAGSIAGLIVVILLLLYRRSWERKLRDRLAADGVTTSKLSWFEPEMTRAERRALKKIEGQSALLADAYRETLAARLTATRVIGNAKRELVVVEGRLQRAQGMPDPSKTSAVEEELRNDRARLERVTREALDHQTEAEARLQMIEATASRGASEAETRLALGRLNTMRELAPYGLEAARLESETRDQIEKELREGDGRLSS